MARTWKELDGCKVLATDGEIGEVKDFFFDIQEWTVRYFIVRTGSWLRHRDVLIAPEAVKAPRFDADDCAAAGRSHAGPGAQQSGRRYGGAAVAERGGRYRGYFAWPTYWPIGMYTPTGVGMGVGPLTPAPGDRGAGRRARARAAGGVAPAARRRGEGIFDPCAGRCYRRGARLRLRRAGLADQVPGHRHAQVAAGAHCGDLAAVDPVGRLGGACGGRRLAARGNRACAGVSGRCGRDAGVRGEPAAALRAS